MAVATTQRVSDLVEVKGEFLPFIDLRQVGNASYRRQCRDSYVYTDEDFRYFQLLYRGIAGLLPQKKRNLILLGPFGVGKSLNLMVTYDLFTSKRNAEVLKNFRDPALKTQLTSLTEEAPFLVVVLMGTKVEGSLQDALVEALIQVMPPGVDLASDFSRAAQYLDWLSAPERRELKERFERALRERNPALDVGTLRKGVSSRREHLDLLREVYESAFGMPYPRLGAVSPSAVYAEAMKELVGKGKPYGGLLVLFDEFGQWVNDRARGEDYPTLTEFGEWIHSCETAFMVVATQAIPRNFRTTDDYDRFHTFRGRCEDFQLRRENYEDLIGGALRERGRNKDAIKAHPYWAKLAELQRAYHPTYRADAQKAAWGYYPFHPGVIAALRPLADKLGQYERTIFKFVDPTEERGLGAFLSEPTIRPDGSLNLLTLDCLFSYFRDEIAQELADTYSRYEEAASENRDHALGMRVLQLLVLLHVLGPDAPCTATAAHVTDLLAEPDAPRVTEALSRLEEQGHVFVENGAYHLTEAGAITRRQVEARLNQVVVRDTAAVTAQDLLTEVRNYARHAAAVGEPSRRPGLPISEEVESQGFRRKYSVRRRFSLRPIGWREVTSLADEVAKGSRELDPATIYVVVVTDEENERGTALNEARKAAVQLASAWACVGIPATPFGDSTVVRAVRAVRILESERPYAGTRALEQEQKRRLRELLAALDGFAAPSNFQWYSPLGSPMQAPSSAGELADRLALHYGAKFPPGIRSEDVVGMPTINSEVVQSLSKPTTFGLRVQKKKADQIIEQALVPLGLVEVGKPKPTDTEAPATVSKPEPSAYKESAEIYGVIDQVLPPGRHDSKCIGDAIQKLSRPPYWLPRDLIAYYVAGFLTNCEATLLQNDHPQARTQEVLKRLIDADGKGFAIEVPTRLTMDDDMRGYLHAVANRVAQSVKNPKYLGSLQVARRDGVLRRREWEQISADLGTWWREVGVLAKARRDDDPAALETFACQLLDLFDQGFRDGYTDDPEFFINTVPAKLADNGKVGALGTKVVAALGAIVQLAKAPRPSPGKPPLTQPSEAKPSAETTPSGEQVTEPGEESATEAPISLTAMRALLTLLEDVCRAVETGARGPSFKELVERMRVAVESMQEGSTR